MRHEAEGRGLRRRSVVAGAVSVSGRATLLDPADRVEVVGDEQREPTVRHRPVTRSIRSSRRSARSCGGEAQDLEGGHASGWRKA
jgi:hypothetical protein